MEEISLDQLEEMQEVLFKQQCDLDIQKAMVKHFIKKKQAEECDCNSHVACIKCGEEKGLDGDFWKRKD